MDGNIGRARFKYRIHGESSPGAVSARLDSLLRSEMPGAIEPLLDRAMAGDPTVYVLRRVRSSALLRIHAGVPDRRAVEHLARRLAAAIVGAIANAGTGECVTFPNRAEYVASFLGDLLRGAAWDSWVYCAFLRFRGLPLADAAATVLSGERESLPQVLAALHRRGALNGVLAVLPRTGLEALWSQQFGTLSAADSLQPLFTAAFEIAERLGTWTGTPPDRRHCFQRWSATYSPVADWGNRTALTAIVASVLRWFCERGLAVAATSSRVPFREALAGMDWLDIETLASALGIEHGVSHPAIPEAPGGSRGEPIPQPMVHPVRRRTTPRQAALLEHLVALLGDFRPAPDSLAAPETRIRLYALLIAAHPEWAGVEIAPPVIERVLAAAAALAQGQSPAEACRHMLRGDVPAALRTLPAAAPAQTAAALQFIADAGRPALEAVTRLASGESADALQCADEIQTACAGLFLLLRGVLGIRLSAACYAAGFAVPPLLAALAMRFAGGAVWRNGALDPAIALFSGWEGTIPELRQAWSAVMPADHERFQFALFQIMQSQRIPNYDEEPRADALASLTAGALELPETDPAVARTACCVLRAWARWLRGFADSTVPFLLKNFIRRPGVLVWRDTHVTVRLAPSPFDIVLEMAGYFDPIPLTPGLVPVGVSFQRSRGRPEPGATHL